MPVEVIHEVSPSSKPTNINNPNVVFTVSNDTTDNNGTKSPLNHYIEFHRRYSDLAGQDDVETFLFTSESVGEGHPGKNK